MKEGDVEDGNGDFGYKKESGRMKNGILDSLRNPRRMEREILDCKRFL